MSENDLCLAWIFKLQNSWEALVSNCLISPGISPLQYIESVIVRILFLDKMATASTTELPDVDDVLKVYWAQDKKWYLTKVIAFYPQTGKYRLQYETSEWEEVDLAKVEFREATGREKKMYGRKRTRSTPITSGRSSTKLETLAERLCHLEDHLPLAAVKSQNMNWWSEWRQRADTASTVGGGKLVALSTVMQELADQLHSNVTSMWCHQEGVMWKETVTTAKSSSDLEKCLEEFQTRAIVWSKVLDLFKAEKQVVRACKENMHDSFPKDFADMADMVEKVCGEGNRERRATKKWKHSGKENIERSQDVNGRQQKMVPCSDSSLAESRRKNRPVEDEARKEQVPQAMVISSNKYFSQSPDEPPMAATKCMPANNDGLDKRGGNVEQSQLACHGATPIKRARLGDEGKKIRVDRGFGGENDQHVDGLPSVNKTELRGGHRKASGHKLNGEALIGISVNVAAPPSVRCHVCIKAKQKCGSSRAPKACLQKSGGNQNLPPVWQTARQALINLPEGQDSECAMKTSFGHSNLQPGRVDEARRESLPSMHRVRVDGRRSKQGSSMWEDTVSSRVCPGSSLEGTEVVHKMKDSTMSDSEIFGEEDIMDVDVAPSLVNLKETSLRPQIAGKRRDMEHVKREHASSSYLDPIHRRAGGKVESNRSFYSSSDGSSGVKHPSLHSQPVSWLGSTMDVRVPTPHSTPLSEQAPGLLSHHTRRRSSETISHVLSHHFSPDFHFKNITRSFQELAGPSVGHPSPSLHSTLSDNCSSPRNQGRSESSPAALPAVLTNTSSKASTPCLASLQPSPSTDSPAAQNSLLSDRTQYWAKLMKAKREEVRETEDNEEDAELLGVVVGGSSYSQLPSLTS